MLSRVIAAFTRLTLAFASLSVSTAAIAGSVITMESRDLRESPAEVSTVLITADDSSMRMDTTGQDPSEASTMIFSGDANEMTAIDHESREYYVIDEAAMESIAGQLNGVMQQMQEALKDLPPEQRAMAEQMMKQRMGAMGQSAAAKAPPQLRSTGESDTVSGLDCDVYEVIESDRRVRDMCVTDWSNVEGGEDFKDNIVKMAEFFQSLRDVYQQSGIDIGAGGDAFAYLDDVNGFPVRLREYESDDRIADETTLVSSESRSVDTALFQPPADYTRRSLQR